MSQRWGQFAVDGVLSYCIGPNLICNSTRRLVKGGPSISRRGAYAVWEALSCSEYSGLILPSLSQASAERWVNGEDAPSGAAVFDQVASVLHRHVRCATDDLVVLALYVMATYCFSLAPVMPHLAIQARPSPQNDALMSLLEQLTFNGIRVPVTALHRMCDLLTWVSCTVIVDEAGRLGDREKDVIRAGFSEKNRVVVADAGEKRIRFPVLASANGPRILFGRRVTDPDLAMRSVKVCLEPQDKAGTFAFAEDLDEVTEGLHLWSLQNAKTIQACKTVTEPMLALLASIADSIDEETKTRDLLGLLLTHTRRDSVTGFNETGPRDEGRVLATLVLQYAKDYQPEKPPFHRGDLFCAYVNETNLLGKKLDTHEVGARLNAWRLVARRRRFRYKTHAPLEWPSETPERPTMQTVYWFDLKRAQDLACPPPSTLNDDRPTQARTPTSTEIDALLARASP